MSVLRPSPITAVMIAAADLENAEFERDRLSLVCGDAVRRALAAGCTTAEIARAIALEETDVLRLAGQPGPAPEQDDLDTGAAAAERGMRGVAAHPAGSADGCGSLADVTPLRLVQETASAAVVPSEVTDGAP